MAEPGGPAGGSARSAAGRRRSSSEGGRASGGGGSPSLGGGRSAEARLEGALARVLPNGKGAAVEAVRPLPGGVSNRCFHVRTPRGDFAVKLRETGIGYVLGLEAELELTRRVAAAGLAPRPVGADPQSGALVTEYRAGGRAMTPEAVREPGNIERIAGLLRDLHRVSAELRELECARWVRGYIEAAGGRAALDPEDRMLARECLSLAEDLDRCRTATVVCHNDLVADNLLDDGALLLVDFEYAVRAAAMLDLASLAAMNGFDADERALLIGAYGAGAGPAIDLGALERVVRLVNLMARFWALAAARETADASRFAAYL